MNTSFRLLFGLSFSSAYVSWWMSCSAHIQRCVVIGRLGKMVWNLPPLEIRWKKIALSMFVWVQISKTNRSDSCLLAAIFDALSSGLY